MTPRGRVALVRLSALGDVVLATAAARALARQRPDLAVTLVTGEAWAPLVREQPDFDVLAVPRDRAGSAAARATVRAAGFAHAVDLQTNRRSNALLAGHPGRLAWSAARGLRRRWVWMRFTRPAPVRPAWLRFVDALAPLGVRAEIAAPPRLVPAAADLARADARLRAWSAAGGGDGPVALLAPGARWASKRWPEAAFVALGTELVAAGARVLVAGDATDRAELPDLLAWTGTEPAAEWPRTDLPELRALAARARVAVANDTGLGHLAAAVGTPVVSIFGSTHPALGFAVAGEGHRTFVRGLACQPCTLHGRRGCPLLHHRCVKEIALADVLGAARERLAGPTGAAAAAAGG